MFPLENFSVSDPVILLQALVVGAGAVLLFLLLFTLRDIILRTRSFWYQAACVLIVGALPIVGFLVYLLIRPARTIKEREMEALLYELRDYIADKPDAPPADAPSVDTVDPSPSML